MSEFSESYHIRSECVEDAIDLLRRAKRKGYVYQPINGWVTFLAEEGMFEPDEQIVAAAKHPLLHYVSAEDHGWSFTLFNDTKILSKYRCEWDNDVSFDDSNYSRSAIAQIVPIINNTLFEDIERRLRPKTIDEVFEAEPAKLLAQAIGLEHYDWLDHDHIARDYHESPQDYPDLVKVT